MEAENRSELLELWVGKQFIRVDPVRTREAYQNIGTPWADECRCTPCRNFALQRQTAYPSSFLLLLRELGIDSQKESEVFGCYPMASGKRQYGGWFFFCGELLVDTGGEVTQDEVSYHVRGPGNMPAPDEIFEPHPLALEFSIELPWVLVNEDPDELYGPATSIAQRS